jgi:hypothetical protein
MRRLLNLWPPYLAAGIKVNYIAEDLKKVSVSMPLKFRNKNYAGTHFGGSLYSMVDPFYMLIKILGKNYIIWDKSATID